MIRRRVDFPQPEGPTSAMNSPADTSKEMSSRTTSGPVGSGNSLLTFAIERESGAFPGRSAGARDSGAVTDSGIDAEFYGTVGVKSPPHEAVQDADRDHHRDERPCQQARV